MLGFFTCRLPRYCKLAMTLETHGESHYLSYRTYRAFKMIDCFGCRPAMTIGTHRKQTNANLLKCPLVGELWCVALKMFCFGGNEQGISTFVVFVPNAKKFLLCADIDTIAWVKNRKIIAFMIDNHNKMGKTWVVFNLYKHWKACFEK